MNITFFGTKVIVNVLKDKCTKKAKAYTEVTVLTNVCGVSLLLTMKMLNSVENATKTAKNATVQLMTNVSIALNSLL